MKTLLLILFTTVAAMVNFSPEAEQPSLDLQLWSELKFDEKVKVYDYDGNLVSEYLLSDVANEEISVIDHLVLEKSDFAFDYLGDYYYFQQQ
ncbi:MAG: hypothetical protein AAF616_02120 [Bacteroidota bacterium]